MESDKDLWNAPSTSKSVQHFQNADEDKQASDHSLEREIPPATILLDNKRIFQNKSSSRSKDLRDDSDVTINKQQASTTTFFFEPGVPFTSPDPKDVSTYSENTSPSTSAPKEKNQSEEPNKSEESLGPVAPDHLEHNNHFHPEALEQRIDSQSDVEDFVQKQSLPGSSEGGVPLGEPQLYQAGPSSKENTEIKSSTKEDTEVKYLTFGDSEKEMYEFMKNIYNPSPYIQKQKLEYEKSKYNQYNERIAMKIMERMIRSSMSPTPPVSSVLSLDSEKLDHLTRKVNELEGRLKEIDLEMRRSEEEKKLLLEQVNELELRVLETKKLNLMKQIASTDEPSEKDIEILSQLKDLLKYQDDSSKELKELERQNRIMERVLSQAESSLSSSPWFHSNGSEAPPQPQEEPEQEPLPLNNPPLPSVRKKIHFNKVSIVVYFDNKDAPKKVPRWNSELVEKISLNDSEEAKSRESDLEDDQLLEEKMEELRKKKEEEKLVKLKSPMEGIEDDLSNTSDSNEGSSTSIKDEK